MKVRVVKPVRLQINREGLRVGTYQGQITIQSNDRNRRQVDIPISMDVVLPTALIVSGPNEGEVIGDDNINFRFSHENAYGLI
jgi:hypothetical protein